MAPHCLFVAAGVALSAMLGSCTQAPRAEYTLMPGEKPADPKAPYPDFSKPLSSAMDQMSDEDAQTMDKQLAALAARRRSGAISEAEYWRRVKEMREIGDRTAKPAT